MAARPDRFLRNQERCRTGQVRRAATEVHMDPPGPLSHPYVPLQPLAEGHQRNSGLEQEDQVAWALPVPGLRTRLVHVSVRLHPSPMQPLTRVVPNRPDWDFTTDARYAIPNLNLSSADFKVLSGLRVHVCRMLLGDLDHLAAHVHEGLARLDPAEARQWKERVREVVDIRSDLARLAAPKPDGEADLLPVFTESGAQESETILVHSGSRVSRGSRV
jgi:hypothetical protein